MAKTYKQLTMEDRCLIQTQLSMGWRPAAIAAGLQRARSTITREMLRNRWKRKPEGVRRGHPAASAACRDPVPPAHARQAP
jgi:IS30 family transposase